MRILSVVLVLLINVDTIAQEAWTRLADIPEGGLYYNSFVFQGNAYVVRFEFGDEEQDQDVYTFDYETELFTYDFSIPIDFRALFVLNNKVYFTQLDGNDSSVNMWRYNPLTQALVQKNDVTDEFGSFGSFIPQAWVIDNKAYIGLPGNGTGKNMFQYDEANDIWIEKASNPYGFDSSVQSFTQNGKAYTVFGFKDLGDFSSDVWEYNPQNDSWLQKADYPTVFRGATAAFTLENYTYVGTGNSEGLPIGSKSFYRYHAEDDSWERIEDAGYAMYGAFSFSLDGFGYFGAGREFEFATDDNPDEFIDQTEVWRLDPQFLNIHTSDKNVISIFPNPVLDFIEISEGLPTATFKIFDISG